MTRPSSSTAWRPSLLTFASVTAVLACNVRPGNEVSRVRGMGAEARYAATFSDCSCTGTGPGGQAVTASCGQSACGSDFTTYACDADGWSWTGQACTGNSDAAVPPCACLGTGPGNASVTAECGQSACGSDYFTYSCSVSGWSWTGEACTGNDDAGPPPCQCTGTGPGGASVTASCGQSACGSDFISYSCSTSGWSWTGEACTGNDDAGPPPCQCTGTGPGGAPVTASCGQSACGSDFITYSCSTSGWSWTGQACTGNGDAGIDCHCSGTGPDDVPVTVACRESACGSDYITYLCSVSGWSWTGASCSGNGGATGNGGTTSTGGASGTGGALAGR
jgi:hypothetical protein